LLKPAVDEVKHPKQEIHWDDELLGSGGSRSAGAADAGLVQQPGPVLIVLLLL
jgi:hypothetical protein